MRSRSSHRNILGGMTDNVEEFEEKRKYPHHVIPTFVSILFLVFLLVVFKFALVIENQLPTALKLNDEEKYPNRFITERARNDLKYLTDLGPRVVGSHENEVLTVEFLKRQITEISANADESQKIELDVQIVSGSYLLDTRPTRKINIYANLQNIVVKLHGKNSNNSLLVNAHFDSVPTSPGGSDNGINVVACLELLRKFSKQKTRHAFSTIFLFNGAEESGMQASHGFITKHKWANECKAVINLDAAGAGGKISMFQTGPNRPWLNKDYGKVPHPFAHVASEELFQANVIPSDTDFRIFRDFGQAVGIDMAFIKDGYRYHTKFDGFNNIPLGSFQHLGDNLMSLARSIANNPDLIDEHPETGHVIFFDYFGGFFVSYSTRAGFFINLCIFVASSLVFLISLQRFQLGFSINSVFYLMQILAMALLGWLLAALSVISFAYFIDLIGFGMSWYGHPWLVLGLFTIPVVLTSTPLLLLIQPLNISKNANSFIQGQIFRLIWSFILLISTLLGLRSTYPLSVLVLFDCLAYGLILMFHFELSVTKWKIIYVVVSIIPATFQMAFSATLLEFIIPLCGRIGSNKIPDVIIGFLTVFITLLILTPYYSFMVCLKKPSSFYKILSVIFLGCFFVVFTPLGFPYSGDANSPTPQRFWILHSQRVFHDEDGGVIKKDSGYFFLNMDRNSPRSVRRYVDDLKRAKDLQEDCENFLLCGLPLAHQKMSEIVKYSSWIPASPPIITEPVEMKLIEKKTISRNLYRYNLTISGPDHTMFYMSPKKKLNLTKINLVNNLPDDFSLWNDRPFYFFVYVWGKEKAPLNIIFDIEVPDNFTGPCVDLAVSGNYVHPKKTRITPDFQKFLSKFPVWTDVTSWVANYKSWSI